MPTLTIGDPAPWFTPPSIAKSAPDLIVGGYRVVLFFFGSSRDPRIQPLIASFLAAQHQFEQSGFTFLGVTIDKNDKNLESQIEEPSQFQFLWDFEGELSIRYGVCQLDKSANGGGIAYDPTTFILDENLRVLDVIPLETHVPHVDRVLRTIQTIQTSPAPRLIRHVAPALFVPNVFPPDFCQYLIDRYEADGGTESGFMKQEADKAVVVVDPDVKRRRDLMITEPELLNQINGYIWRRVKPEIEKAFQFRITCFERYLVACYEEQTRGFFKPHRDNVNIGAAHRRFAMTLNLNSGYEGGCLRFPEYGADLYSPEAGSAVVFSCSLLHEVTPVTQGRRFVLLSFFYNDQDAKLREQTRQKIVREDGGSSFEAGNRSIVPQTNPSPPAKTLPSQPSPSSKQSKKPGGFRSQKSK